MTRLLNPIDEHTLVVCLPEFDFQPRRGRLLAESFLNVGKRADTVNLRLSLANEIQVRTIKNKNWLHWHECGNLPLETETPPAFTEAEVRLLEISIVQRTAKRQDTPNEPLLSVTSFYDAVQKASGFFFVFCTGRRGGFRTSFAALFASFIH